MTFQGTRSATLPDRDMGHLWDNGTGYPNAEPLRICNPVKHLDHAKREVVRYFDIPADAVIAAAHRAEELGRT